MCFAFEGGGGGPREKSRTAAEGMQCSERGGGRGDEGVAHGRGGGGREDGAGGDQEEAEGAAIGGGAKDVWRRGRARERRE